MNDAPEASEPTESTAAIAATEPLADVAMREPAAHQTSGLDRRIVALTFGIAAVVFALDQLTKVWALNALTIGEPQRNLLGEYLSLRLVLNPGAALGIGYGYTWILTIVVVIVVAVMVRMITRIRSKMWAVTLGMLLGGALGNLFDRLFREPGFAHGHVVDFIGYWNWFTGNVADIAIVAAAVLLCLLAMFGYRLDGTREGHESADENRGESAEPETN